LLLGHLGAYVYISLFAENTIELFLIMGLHFSCVIPYYGN
jgi:hypothetical protein